jgi:hypothetical protein
LPKWATVVAKGPASHVHYWIMPESDAVEEVADMCVPSIYIEKVARRPNVMTLVAVLRADFRYHLWGLLNFSPDETMQYLPRTGATEGLFSVH